ncbi:hypothetical protein HMF8227_00336 [Saliniradius amylolyticus]|uniref:Uncharacterized protein n=1 Tax=Saliniradius amylolyticus TaxID=2183582 RepID=A0A2S2DZX7_9ALTE|nr:hypothetical protein [Saliniradius amylolyticus]AWL10842.1 hypothetical protein HMF8227_00336 [Saliniradius amylolyticus]
MDDFIRYTFKNTVEFHQQAMSRFRPCKPQGEMAEANLTFSFIHSALRTCPQAGWGLEVPFTDGDKSNSPWNKHIDGYLFVDNTLYLIEVKRDYPVSDFSDYVCKDLKRLSSPHLADAFVRMLDRPVYSQPLGQIKAVKAVLLADTWRAENVRYWASAELKGEKQRWLSELHRDVQAMPFTAGNSAAPYSLLIAQSDNLDSFLARMHARQSGSSEEECLV